MLDTQYTLAVAIIFITVNGLSMVLMAYSIFLIKCPGIQKFNHCHKEINIYMCIYRIFKIMTISVLLIIAKHNSQTQSKLLAITHTLLISNDSKSYSKIM